MSGLWEHFLSPSYVETKFAWLWWVVNPYLLMNLKTSSCDLIIENTFLPLLLWNHMDFSLPHTVVEFCHTYINLAWNLALLKPNQKSKKTTVLNVSCLFLLATIFLLLSRKPTFVTHYLCHFPWITSFSIRDDLHVANFGGQFIVLI